jgi:hypothetical protein
LFGGVARIVRNNHVCSGGFSIYILNVNVLYFLFVSFYSQLSPPVSEVLLSTLL